MYLLPQRQHTELHCHLRTKCGDPAMDETETSASQRRKKQSSGDGKPKPVSWPRTASADEAAELLMAELEDWITQSIERHRNTPWQGVHDEGSFASSWFGFLLIRQRQDVESFLRELRASFREWAKKNYYHGYYPRQEVHHGPENHLYFQPRFGAIDPKDALTIEILEDMAHHIGNWVAGIPDWFAWNRRLFRGTILGTREVDDTPPNDINIAEHFRFVLISLALYKLTGNARYLGWPEAYVSRWLEAFESSPRVPVALHAEISPEQVETRYSRVRNSFLGAAPSEIGETVNRIEAHVANGTMDALIDLSSLSGKGMYHRCAGRLLRHLLPTLTDTHNHPTGLLLMKYRAVTGDDSLDDEAMRILESVSLGKIPEEYSWDPTYSWSKEELLGPGKRHDMIRWMRRDAGGAWQPDISPSPASLMLAYQISGHEMYAKRSLDLATARLRVAKANFDDGRKHGCADRTISAVVRGNGRCHNAGNVTGSLFPYAANVFDLCCTPTRVGTSLPPQSSPGTNDTPEARG
jgi:hypothetical protein